MATAEDESQRLLGGFIRAQRQMANLSLRQLSVLAKVSNPYLSQVERGLHEPSVRVLRSIADALDLSAGTLFEQAGLIGDTECSSHSVTCSSHSVTEHAIGADRRLTEFQRRAMLSVYRSYVEDNSSKSDHPLVGLCPPSPADRMGDSTS